MNIAGLQHILRGFWLATALLALVHASHAARDASQPVVDAEVIARISAIDGSALATGPGGARILRRGAALYAGDRLRTREATLTVRFVDDSEVELEAFSSFVIGADSEPTRAGDLAVRFEIGRARMRTGNLRRAAYRVETPLAVIGLRGTYFEIRVDGLGGTLVQLLRDVDGSVGELFVATEAGRVDLVRAGEATRVDAAGTLPSTPAILDLSVGDSRASDAGDADAVSDDSESAAATADEDPLAGAVFELQRDLLATRLLDEDPLRIEDGDGLSSTGLLEDDLATAAAAPSATDAASISSETGAVLERVVAPVDDEGTTVSVSVPSVQATRVVVDPSASVEGVLAESRTSNVIVVIPTP
jgi:hypothetical protein